MNICKYIFLSIILVYMKMLKKVVHSIYYVKKTFSLEIGNKININPKKYLPLIFHHEFIVSLVKFIDTLWWGSKLFDAISEKTKLFKIWQRYLAGCFNEGSFALWNKRRLRSMICIMPLARYNRKMQWKTFPAPLPVATKTGSGSWKVRFLRQADWFELELFILWIFLLVAFRWQTMHPVEWSSPEGAYFDFSQGTSSVGGQRVVPDGCCSHQDREV